MSVKLSKSSTSKKGNDSNKKSKKVKNNNINKTQLWKIFEDNVDNEKKSDPLECIYRNSGNRENCELCESTLAFSDEGFLTCTNNSCGIIYKDILAAKALQLINAKKITSLCVNDKKTKNKTIGILHIHKILEADVS